MPSAALSEHGGSRTLPAWRPGVTMVTSLAVGGVLMTAALLKAADPRDTLAVLGFVFGSSAAPVLLRVLLTVEIVLASALLVCLSPPRTLLVAALLFAVFLGWTGYLTVTRAPLGCGCGFPDTHWLLGDGHGAAALRAGGLMVVSLSGSLIARRRPPGETEQERKPR